MSPDPWARADGKEQVSRLGTRNEEGAGRHIALLRLPGALDRRQDVTFERFRLELHLGRPERLDLDSRVRRFEDFERKAMEAKLLAEPGSLGRRHDVSGARKLDTDCRLELVEKGHLPYLWLARVVTRPKAARDVRRIPAVRISPELYRHRFAGGFEGQWDLRRAARASGLVGRAGCFQPLNPMACREVDQAFEDIPRHPHAGLVVLPGMGLHQHREAVSGRPVRRTETGRRDADRKARARIILLEEGGVEGQRQMALPFESLEQRVPRRARLIAQWLGPPVDRLEEDGDVRLELRAVGDMEIGKENGIPRVHQLQHRHHLRGIRLGVVAIEVEILPRHPPAHLLGAVLIRPVMGTEALVAIDVEDGHEDEGHLRQGPGDGFVLEELAKKPEAGVLAVDLSGMNPALHEDDRPALFPSGLRLEGRVRGCHQRQHRPAFRRRPEAAAANLLRIGFLKGRAKLHDFVVATGLRPAAPFCGGGQRSHGNRGDREQ